MSIGIVAAVSWFALVFGALAQSERADGAAKDAPTVELVVPEFANETCPIMGKPVSKALYADTDRGRIYVCCKPCIKKIQKDVVKAHRTAYPVVKPAANATCPITAKPVDADVPQAIVQASSIGVCCSECTPKAAQRSQVVLARIHDPELVDLENQACPITGEEADPNTIGVVDGAIVRFATRKARSEAKKDPAAALAKAREIVAQQKAGTLKLVPHPDRPQADADDEPAADPDGDEHEEREAPRPSRAKEDTKDGA